MHFGRHDLPGCDIGCEIKVMIKDENLVRIETTDRTSPRGALCKSAGSNN